QQQRCDAHVVVNHLSLGESGFGIQNLVEVRKLQVLSLDVNHGLFGHWFLTRCTEMMQVERASMQLTGESWRDSIGMSGRGCSPPFDLRVLICNFLTCA